METGDSSEKDTHRKQAACLECRKSKIKCIRTKEGALCQKCEAAGIACIVPAYHVGRYKGVKNKRSGLEKAISQVEKAIKKSRNGEGGIDDEQAQALQYLLQQTDGSVQDQQSSYKSSIDQDRRNNSSPLKNTHADEHSPIPQGTAYAGHDEEADELTVNNADNPLQLLAIASAIPEQPALAVPASTVHGATDNNENTIRPDDATQRFFRPLRCKIDVSPELDPIDLGLATEDDAKRLFDYFHLHLAHTRWGMDTQIHTWTFVRSRSAFLFSSVMAASALFLPDTAGLSIRLRNHVRTLVRNIVSGRHRSVEIVLGFMINVPWMIPGEAWAADDDTCYYISLALTTALDLSLNRIILPSSTLRPPGFLDRTAKADCIDSAKALAMDGLDHVDPTSDFGKRCLRTRERIWLALFNLDRGVCLARGRPPTVQASPLVESCDTWHISDIAENQDSALISATVLRRDFVGLVNSIRSTCENSRLTVNDGSINIRVMRDRTEQFFEQWLETWKFQIQQSDGHLPPYVEILASHTKLSAYCNVINHQIAPPDVKKFFRAAGLASALNVLKVAAQAESRLKSMPNNTVIMVSFAAFFVLGLGNDKGGSTSLVAPNTKSLIDEVANVLERLGSIPAHRQGASKWFGRHIKAMTKGLSEPDAKQKQVTDLGDLVAVDPVVPAPEQNGLSLMHNFDLDAPGTTVDDFSIFDMSNDEIIDAITNSNANTQMLNSDIVYDETQFIDWFETW